MKYQVIVPSPGWSTTFTCTSPVKIRYAQLRINGKLFDNTGEIPAGTHKMSFFTGAALHCGLLIDPVITIMFDTAATSPPTVECVRETVDVTWNRSPATYMQVLEMKSTDRFQKFISYSTTGQCVLTYIA